MELLTRRSGLRLYCLMFNAKVPWYLASTRRAIQPKSDLSASIDLFSYMAQELADERLSGGIVGVHGSIFSTFERFFRFSVPRHMRRKGSAIGLQRFHSLELKENGTTELRWRRQIKPGSRERCFDVGFRIGKRRDWINEKWIPSRHLHARSTGGWKRLGHQHVPLPEMHHRILRLRLLF